VAQENEADPEHFGIDTQTATPPRTGRSVLISQLAPPSQHSRVRSDKSACECSGSAKLLTFRSGQGHASHGRLRADQIEPSAMQCPAPACRPATPVPARPGRDGSATADVPCQARPLGISSRTNAAPPVPSEASHSPAIAKIISDFGSPFGSLTIISSYEKQWAQQGSNLRPLACKARTYRRWTWLDVAQCGICQPRLWLDVA
jgi:hypothetical protein